MQRFKATLAALMCVCLTNPSAFAETVPSPSPKTPSHARPPYESGQLQGDERILHALNRFSFGPRPGDLEAVRAMGLDQWFNQQLHPGTLDQTDLNTRLAQFPAMQLDPQTLLFRYPSNAIIRQVADGKAPIPQNPALKAIYDNELARVEQRREAKEQKNQQLASIAPNAPANPSTAINPSMGPSAVTPQAMAEAMIQGQDLPAAPATMDGGTAATMVPDPGQTNMMAAPANADQPPFPQERIDHILALSPPERISRLGTLS